MLMGTVAALALLLVGASSGPVTVDPGKIVRWAGSGIESCALGESTWQPLEGACFYPMDLLHRKGSLVLRRTRAGSVETRTVLVAAFAYPVQRLTLPRGMVELSPRDLERVQRENRMIVPLWSRTGPRRFGLPLAPPLDQLPAGERFGSRRIINGVRKSPHSGRDYRALAGTPILAVADGVVALVGNHFFGGNSVFIDHGDGLISMYMHMSMVDVEQGQEVRRGQKIGAVGATGRATGPHLHFGVRWHGARVDPNVVLGIEPPIDIE
jgi:murein DD-endopeptidase MepM/ murein hydrolase activator NlpD